MSLTRTTARTTGVALRAMLVFTLALGIGYTVLITAIGQLALPWQANGSLLTDSDGQTVGSALIGQQASDADGHPLPEYFQPRPSAVGYDAGGSSGSNLGPESDDLIAAIGERRAAVAGFEGVDPAAIPADALTASASGLDPHISAAYALLQAPRVAAARGLDAAEVRELVESRIQSRDLGYLGEPRVNVLELNLALDESQE
ncbi:potassium-transporting ATPase subunit KdpC [Microbacterium terricola]|uniref:Potassium-transporting ATPase KdpC subunit n=1 Tax=Microbacterium terricola TaxID=344163 RepID=A0ABM8DW71_9MICO|nr:potassium-transporting ATPase subunit KdpC [Microbacterium terricola]UYK39434.1 potassium-transporting ATPase subunit KdpC [Microbacterium terricola]BDV29839.1 potassium-transporting ATPase KdpC subunit [Microbacterium terricola]